MTKSFFLFVSHLKLFYNCNFERREEAIVILYKERIKIPSPSFVVSLKIPNPSKASSALKAMADRLATPLGTENEVLVSKELLVAQDDIRSIGKNVDTLLMELDQHALEA